MLRKMVLLLVPVTAGAAVTVNQWPDIRRYIKIKQLSTGSGHPENVPVGGGTAYPQHPGEGDADGTGDFDSARRGGPAS